jgi:general stress protein 26
VHTDTSAPHQAAVQKLRELIKDIEFAMLVTRASDGALRARPMATQKVEFDGDLWFFTNASAEKSAELRENPIVNISYANPTDQRYVSISGVAELIRDVARAKELWHPAYRAYFPNGPDDPDMLLIRVHVDKVEYWDPPTGVMRQLVGLVKAVVSGQRFEPGGHEKLSFDGRSSARS